jgi:antitoxin PrlF
MTAITASSNGQIVLPASFRKRLGLIAGSHLEAIDEPDGLRLIVSRAIETTNIVASAGLVKAPARGKPRRLSDFDPAMLLAKKP